MEEENKDLDNFEVADVEDFREKDTQFSHQVLVMVCLRKCLENGMCEMVEGKMETKKDKFGNTLTIYRPDTRKKFIESVKTAKNFMACDFDDEAKYKIFRLLKRIKERNLYWVNEEWEWSQALDYKSQLELKKQNRLVIKGLFNFNNQFYNYCLDDEIEIYRRILEQLNKLTKRLDFYKAEVTEG